MLKPTAKENYNSVIWKFYTLQISLLTKNERLSSIRGECKLQDGIVPVNDYASPHRFYKNITLSKLNALTVLFPGISGMQRPSFVLSQKLARVFGFQIRVSVIFSIFPIVFILLSVAHLESIA